MQAACFFVHEEIEEHLAVQVVHDFAAERLDNLLRLAVAEQLRGDVGKKSRPRFRLRMELLAIQRIEGIGKVLAQRFEQANLLGVEGMGIAGIECQYGRWLAVAAERKTGRGQKAEAEGGPARGPSADRRRNPR